jgi:hypothetical protein
MIKWNIACYDSSWLQPHSIRQNGFKLEHTESDRWEIEELDEEISERGYSTYSILHVTFGPTEKDFCNFKVIMNSQDEVVSLS